MPHLRPVLLVLLALLPGSGCRFTLGEGTWYYAVGWSHYQLPGCRSPEVRSGTSLVRYVGGFRAERPGVTRLRCGDRDARRIVVLAADTLVLEGPGRLARGTFAHLRVSARAQGRAVDLGAGSEIDWSVTGAGQIQRAFCSDFPLFGCPGNDSARLRADAPGRLTVTVRFGGLVATHVVTVE